MPELHGHAQAPQDDSRGLDGSPALGAPGPGYVPPSSPHQVITKRVDPNFVRGLNTERFAREVAAAALLSHPNIIPVLEAGVLDDGVPFYTMPLIEGETLRARVTREPLALIDALTILCDVAKALDFAHGKGIVHCNLNPENVLLVGAAALVSEFGVGRAIMAARPASDVPSLHNTTVKLGDLGVGFGTPAYMAPEQTLGDGNIDARADIYAFGCMAYELVADGPPCGSRASAQLMMAHVSKMPQPLASRGAAVPQRMDDLIMSCLRKRPSERPQSAGELVATLEKLILS